MNAAPPLLSIRAVGKSYPGVQALAEVSFDIASGEFHSICGENGAGKSTLMKILSGVITSYDGDLAIAGKIVRFSGTRDAEAAGISIIHQELNLVEQLSATANIFLGRELRGWLGLKDEGAMRRAAVQLLNELECDIDPDALASTLRVGDQQLIEIAKALSLQSDILIMDEPTSALTESEVARLYRVIDRLRKRGVTILYISHKMEEVFRLSDRITILRDGKFIKTLSRDEASPELVTSLMVGREIENIDLGRRPDAGKTLLSVKNLSLAWPGHARGYRLKDISFDLRQGEILGIAGLMGAGRTELLECLFGASPLSPTGEILLEGKPVNFSHPAEACAAGIALVTEDRKRLGIFAEMNVGQNISICSLKDSLSSGMLSHTKEWQLAGDVSKRLLVKTAGLEAAITSLSGGNQQKCIVGRWLLTNPRILLLDDPTRGVDVGAKAELYHLMLDLCREGIGVIITSSELPEILTVSDRILVLSEGCLTGEFLRSEATEEKILHAATSSIKPAKHAS
ncbi:MAG: sugar ABC transporter ATP-binding protein [Pirellulales bacterium]